MVRMGRASTPPQPSIKMTFGKSLGNKYDLLMTSENVFKNKAKGMNNHIVKKRKVSATHNERNKKQKVVSSNSEQPMVVVKTETLDLIMFNNIKTEDEHLADINDLLGDSEAESEDIKPPVSVPAKLNAGIRLTIDKKNMDILMMSDLTPPPSPDIKPDVKELQKQMKPGIKMVIGKSDDTKDEFAVLLESDLKNTTAVEYKCENTGCSKTCSHICVFPPYRQMTGILKTKGILNLKHSFHKQKSGFTIFNKSFYALFGAIFYFKTHVGSHIEVRSRSGIKYKFKMTLYQPGAETKTIITTLGGRKSVALPTTMFSGDAIKYKIVLYVLP